jgi:hypothetical protein
MEGRLDHTREYFTIYHTVINGGDDDDSSGKILWGSMELSLL